MNRRHGRKTIAFAVAMTVFIAAAMLMLVSCQHKPVLPHARFVHLPTGGWQRSLPLTFMPEYDDSTLTYDISLAVRHDNSYRYRNLSLVVDIIATDSTVSRHPVDLSLADEYGNWLGGGFGALYQDEVTVAKNISPMSACSIVVWQTMQGCDTLRGVVDVGVIINP